MPEKKPSALEALAPRKKISYSPPTDESAPVRRAPGGLSPQPSPFKSDETEATDGSVAADSNSLLIDLSEQSQLDLPSIAVAQQFTISCARCGHVSSKDTYESACEERIAHMVDHQKRIDELLKEAFK